MRNGGPRRGFALAVGLILATAGCSAPATPSPVKVGAAEAVETYRQAAERGSAEAQLLLGLAYKLGQGVDVDRAQADHWWQTAAAQGNAAATANLVQLRAQAWEVPACAGSGIPRAWRCRRISSVADALP